MSDAVLAALVEEATAIDAAVAHRDRLIRLARLQGVSLRRIADAAGLSHMTVRKISGEGDG